MGGGAASSSEVERTLARSGGCVSTGARLRDLVAAATSGLVRKEVA